MAGKPKTVAVEVRDKAVSDLANLPEKPKAEKGLALKDAIASMKTEIRAAQEKGYTIEEIVQSLKGSGMDIGLTTLKAAMRQSAKKRTAKAATKVDHQDGNEVAHSASKGGSRAEQEARRTVTPEERQALRQETETTLTPAATKRGVR